LEHKVQGLEKEKENLEIALEETNVGTLTL
jgi:hypothetical protein